MKKTLNMWLNFFFSNTIFPGPIVENNSTQENQGISLSHYHIPPPSNLCWPFCLIHRLMKSVGGFVLPFVMLLLMFPVCNWLLSVLIAEKSCAVMDANSFFLYTRIPKKLYLRRNCQGQNYVSDISQVIFFFSDLYYIFNRNLFFPPLNIRSLLQCGITPPVPLYKDISCWNSMSTEERELWLEFWCIFPVLRGLEKSKSEIRMGASSFTHLIVC